MLSNAQELISSAPLLAIYPGAMIFLTVIAGNLLGDALQQRFDRRAAVRDWGSSKGPAAQTMPRSRSPAMSPSL